MTSSETTYRQWMKSLECIVVMPTYNNGTTISKVIAEVRQYTDDIIVVNDGSTDNTAEILSSLSGIKVIDCKKNQGKGYALKVGLKAAYELGYKYAITIDSDGQHFADDIPVFLNEIEKRPDSLLIGARNLVAENMPARNTFANKFSNFWYRVETGHTLSDTQSGYRLYPLQQLRDIHFITRRYEFEVEIIVRAAWRGIRVENVPVKVYYPPVEERVSHFRPLRDFTRISILNTVLVLYALLFYYPWRFLRSLTPENIRRFVNAYILHSSDSNLRMALAMGWGVFCGIIPIWGYQMIFAGVTSHFMRLNKAIAMVFSNISIPPMIPFILYGSMVMGAQLLGVDDLISLDNISIESVSLSIWQYVIGSLCLASLMGSVVLLLSWLLMNICKRESRSNE